MLENLVKFMESNVSTIGLQFVSHEVQNGNLTFKLLIAEDKGDDVSAPMDEMTIIVNVEIRDEKVLYKVINEFTNVKRSKLVSKEDHNEKHFLDCINNAVDMTL